MIRRLSVTILLLTTVAVPATARAVASAELYRTQTYLYGRFEARIRYAAGDGVVSSFFLWKPGSNATGAFWNELDFEKVAADCHMQTNALYGSPVVGHSQTNPISGGDICATYHDYRFEWTPTYIAWAVDGQEIRRDTGATATAFSQNAAGGMAFHFNIWPGNASFGGNFNPAILPVHEYISWVQYSSYVNGTFPLQWREEFLSGNLPSGWVTGNFPSPYNLSVHSPQNVGFVNGIAVLSLTADNATGSPGVPPVDTGAGGAGTGGSGAGGTGNGGNGAGGAAPGSGGSDAGGGAPGSGGSGAGGAVGTGGATGGTAGSATGGSGAGGSGGTAGSMAGAGMGGQASPSVSQPSVDSGCACNVDKGSSGYVVSVLFALLALVTRLRRSRAARRNGHILGAD